ncbi:alpha/beta hydrolase [Sphingomonas xinjiangensis]|uniref:Acetyl esterase/lipase n=1 Tax=Sphingomonas xinjiangensis TaxID=643568 RepID=A0A840Y9F7_9SPHN|nr:alpha/beta hydrolase [Sphingomonas xinjiangensis]MBB5709474.1 acetyl esterase/lipase [Sphingomonas xinjiangensis]
MHDAIDRRTALLAGLAAASMAPRALAQTAPPAAGQGALWLAFPDPVETIDLWTHPPRSYPKQAEVTIERSKDAAYNDRFVTGITRPRMAVFRPAKPNGAAVLITPGGGYSWVVIDKEGYEMARLLAAQGITAFVLFYRLPHQGWANGANVPLADAQRAMRLIRHHAARYHIDPARVAAVGFSAGGHVCASLLTRFDAQVYAPVDAADRGSARPDAAAPIYPVIAMAAPAAHAGSRKNLLGEHPTPEAERAYSPHLHVPPNAPPCFLLHAEDDASVSVANTLMLREALCAQNIATQTHLFPDGGHGFGLRLARGKSVEHWPDLFLHWLRHTGITG